MPSRDQNNRRHADSHRSSSRYRNNRHHSYSHEDDDSRPRSERYHSDSYGDGNLTLGNLALGLVHQFARDRLTERHHDHEVRRIPSNSEVTQQARWGEDRALQQFTARGRFDNTAQQQSTAWPRYAKHLHPHTQSSTVPGMYYSLLRQSCGVMFEYHVADGRTGEDAPPVYQKRANPATTRQTTPAQSDQVHTQLTSAGPWTFDPGRSMSYRIIEDGRVYCYEDGTRIPVPDAPQAYWDENKKQNYWLHRDGKRWVYDDGTTHPPL
jgi:hypothetical protein